MSGGTFEYSQYRIRDIYEKIQRELDKMGKEKPKEELWGRKEFYEEYPEEKYFIEYPKEVVKILEDGIRHLKLAEIYAQRIDWFLAGDDGEESLVKRLEEDLKDMNHG